jgi:thiol-disulfide isomerase/thioredoxin
VRRILLLSACLLVAPVASAQEASVGKAPPLAAKTLEGDALVLAEALENGPVVVTFWATWCRPCRKELPELQKLVDKYGDRGFRVVAVSGDGPVDAAKVAPYVKSQKFTFDVVRDEDGEIRRNFQVEVFPTTFLLGDDGAILHRQVGYRRGDEKILDGHLAELLGAPEPGVEPGDGTSEGR